MSEAEGGVATAPQTEAPQSVFSLPDEGSPERVPEPEALEPESSGRRGRGRGRARGGRASKGRRGRAVGLDARKSSAGATEVQEGGGGSEEKLRPRRSSRRERVKPQAYSPTHQDRDTRLRRERLKKQELLEKEARVGSRGPSEENQPSRVKSEDSREEEDEDGGDEDDNVPLRLSAQRLEQTGLVKVETESEVPSASAGVVSPPLEDMAAQEAASRADGLPEETAAEVQPQPPELEVPAAAAVEQADGATEAAVKQEVEATPEQQGQQTAVNKVEPTAEATGPAPAVSEQREEGRVNEGELEENAASQVVEVEVAPGMHPAAPEPSLPKASKESQPATVPASQDPAELSLVDQSDTQPPQAEAEEAVDEAAAREKAAEATRGPSSLAAAAKPVPRGTKRTSAVTRSGTEKAVKAPKRQKIDSPESDSEGLEAGKAKQPTDDWDPGETSDRRSESPESDAPTAPRRATRKRLRKPAEEPRKSRQRGKSAGNAEPELKRSKTTKVAVESAESKDAEARADKELPAGKESKGQANADDTKELKAAVTKQQSPVASEPAPKPASQPVPSQPGAKGKAAELSPRERLLQSVAGVNDRLLAGHKQCSEIFQKAQQQAADLLAQIAADVQALDGLAVTEEVLQQTGIGRTVRTLAKPLKPLQQALEVEKKASVLLTRWMKAFPKDGKPPGAPPPTQPLVNTPSTSNKPPAAQARPAGPPPGLNAQPAEAAPQSQGPPPAPAVTAAVPEVAVSTAAQAEPQAPAAPAAEDVVRQSSAEELASRPGVAGGPTTGAGAAAEESVRKRARMVLATALQPHGFVIPPTSAANWLESALYDHYAEEDIGSGKLYLRRLHVIWVWLTSIGPSNQPSLRDLVARGLLHPADLATMSSKDVEQLLLEASEQATPAPSAGHAPPPPATLVG